MLEKEEKKSEVQPKREKETKKIMEVLYKFHDLHEIVKYEEFYEGFDVEECHVNFSKSKSRKWLSLCKKLEISEYYATHKICRETVRVFGLQDSAVKKICKVAPPKKKTTEGVSVVSNVIW